MVFYCQKNSFATSYKTKVVSCQKSSVQLADPEPPADAQQKTAAKKQKQKKEVPCYEVLFEDTVLFPEGGGQPDDRGVIQLATCSNFLDQTDATPAAEDNQQKYLTDSPLTAAETLDDAGNNKELNRLSIQTLTIDESNSTGDSCSSESSNAKCESTSTTIKINAQNGTTKIDSGERCKRNVRSGSENCPSEPVSGKCLSGGIPEHRCSSCTANVLRVLRRGGEAVHYLDRPLDAGAPVVQHVDWARRKDHMQQHSAQHLITAIASNVYGLATTSWSLGLHTSLIELDSGVRLDTEQLNHLEERVNSVIADAVTVTVTEYDVDDPLLDQGIRSRGLPADHAGRVRVVSMGGVDVNMCCGTHVTNTSQLQAVKLLAAESANRGNTCLTFVAGDRLLRHLSSCHARERSLNALLNTSPENYTNVVQKMQAALKIAEKTAKEALRDLASSQAQLFKLTLHSHHKEVAEEEEQRRESKESTTIGAESVTNGAETSTISGIESSAIGVNSCNIDRKSISIGAESTTNGKLPTTTVGKDCTSIGGTSSTAGGPWPSAGCPRLWCHHRRLADMDYLSALVSNCDDQSVLKILTAGEEKGPGLLLIHGPPDLVAAIAPQVCSVLEGKGGGKGRFTGKVTALHKREQAYTLATEYLHKHLQ